MPDLIEETVPLNSFRKQKIVKERLIGMILNQDEIMSS